MNVYLDVDGVLVDRAGNLAPNAELFLSKVVEDDNTYWLTTRCHGDAGPVLSYMEHLVSPEIFELLKKIKPTTWSTYKTEAIDFTRPFVWYDDNPLASEIDQLRSKDCLKSLVRVSKNEYGTPLLPVYADWHSSLFCLC